MTTTRPSWNPTHTHNPDVSTLEPSHDAHSASSAPANMVQFQPAPRFHFDQQHASYAVMPRNYMLYHPSGGSQLGYDTFPPHSAPVAHPHFAYTQGLYPSTLSDTYAQPRPAAVPRSSQSDVYFSSMAAKTRPPGRALTAGLMDAQVDDGASQATESRSDAGSDGDVAYAAPQGLPVDMHESGSDEGFQLNAFQGTPFVSKLWHLLSNDEYRDYIRWNAAGNAFILSHTNTYFASHVLPQYFRHSNCSSFIRQLNLYSFQRMGAIDLLETLNNSSAGLTGTAAPSSCFSGFSHPLFRRDNPALSRSIRPKTNPKPRNQTNKAKKITTGRATTPKAANRHLIPKGAPTSKKSASMSDASRPPTPLSAPPLSMAAFVPEEEYTNGLAALRQSQSPKQEGDIAAAASGASSLPSGFSHLLQQAQRRHQSVEGSAVDRDYFGPTMGSVM